MYALFRGETQLARTFQSKQEVLEAALAERLIPELQVADNSGPRILPADYHIEAMEQTYDPQPDVRLPPEI